MSKKDFSIWAFSLMYQKEEENHNPVMLVKSIVVHYESGDDALSMRHKAEKVMHDDVELNKRIEGFKLVAWDWATIERGG